MGEEGNIILPVKMEIDASDLQALKREVQKTFDDIKKYTEIQGTKKEPYELEGVKELSTIIDDATSKIEELQKEFEAVSKSTPFDDLKLTQHEIGQTLRSIRSDTQDVLSLQSRWGNLTKTVNKAEQQKADIIAKQKQAQKDYAAEIKRVNQAYAKPKASDDPQKQLQAEITNERKREKALSAVEAKYAKINEDLKYQYMQADQVYQLNSKELAAVKEEYATRKGNVAESQKYLANLRLQASEQGKALKNEEYLKEREQERVARLEEINKKMREQEELISNAQYKADKTLKEDKSATGFKTINERKRELETTRRLREEQRELAKAMREASQEDSRRIRVYNEEYRLRNAIRKEAEKAANADKKANAARIQALNKEKAAIKQSTAQYYYKLRALKMLGFQMTALNNTVRTFGKNLVSVASKALTSYLRLIPGVKSLQKALSKTTTSQKKLNKEVKSTNKGLSVQNLTLKDLVKNILKYGLGIRSVFVLFNKLRSAVTAGLGEMSKQFDEVNTTMSSLLTSFNYMKAAITTVVEPIMNVLAPVLEKLSALLSEVTYKIASFIAALTGQSTVLRALRVQADYAESLDKTAKNAKKAKKELSGLDKLNVINSDKDTDKEDSPTMMWERVPIDSIMADWAKKFKDFINRLLAPIKAAWEKMKNYVIGSWKFMCEKLKSLWNAVAEDFWRVWEDPKTQAIFENIFRIIGDVFRIIGTLAGKIEEAWRHNENGYRILSAIRDIIGSIVQHIADATYATLLWAQQLTLVPLFDAIADVLEQQVVPAVDKVLDLLLYLYKEVVLPLAKYVIENILPVLVRAFGNIVESIGNIAERIQKALESGDTGRKIVEKIELIMQKVADAIERMSEKAKEWSANLDFETFFDSVDAFLEKIQPMLDAVIATVEKFWSGVLLPFWKYLIEDGGPKLLDLLGKIFGQYDENTGLGVDWEHLTQVMNNFMDALEPFLELAWETLLQIIEDLGKAFDDFVNSGTLDILVDKFSAWVKDADPEELATKIEKFVEQLIGLTAALALIANVIVPVMTGLGTVFNFFNMIAQNGHIAKIEKDIATLAGREGGKTGFALLKETLGNMGTEFDTFKMVIKNFGDVFAGPETKLGKFIKLLEPLAKPAGILMVIIGLFTSFSSAAEMMDEGFSLAGEAAVVFGGILTSVGLIVAGVAAWPAVIIGALVVLIANLGAFGDDILKWVWETGNSIREKIGDFFHNIGFYLGAAIHEVIAFIIEKLSGLPDEIHKFITETDWKQFGINILEGIFAIFLAIGELISWLGTAIANLIAGFIEGLCTGFDMHSPSKVMEEYGGMILDGILEGIINALTGIGTWILEHIVNPMLDGVKTAFGIVNGVASKFKEIGGNLINGLKEGISSGWDKAKDFVGGIWESVTKSAEDSYEVNSPSKVFDGIGEYLMQGLKDGITSESTEVLKSITTMFTNLLYQVQSKANATTLVNNGINIVKGLLTGITRQWSNLTSSVSNSIGNLVRSFSSKLTSNTLASTGRNLINGLKSGLMSALNSALSAVTSICNRITSAAKKAFQVHSPSKVFEDIGENLMLGLVGGVDEDADKVEDSFNQLIPSVDMLDTFYDRFMDMMNRLTTNAMQLFDDMIAHFEASMNNLDTIFTLSQLNEKLSSLPNITVPDVVKGYRLPSNKDFTDNTSIDLSDLPDIIKKAVIEAITATTDLQSDDEVIMINIDGKNVFQVVKNENAKYKKQHGSSAFT